MDTRKHLKTAMILNNCKWIVGQFFDAYTKWTQILSEFITVTTFLDMWQENLKTSFYVHFPSESVRFKGGWSHSANTDIP